ncbi:hypothetical protein BGW37DRAFT_530684 [Umbelopsis sp. PMI_123]|nr:hypothetical protein BGW37DRAFT_530684 [Umbelopsis sp. PMI_123]
MLRENLSLLFQEYHIPQHMLDHGYTLLQTVIDVNSSNEGNLMLMTESPWHAINNDHYCRNMCYLLVKHLQDLSGSNDASNHVIYRHSRLYGGQTINFRNRESARASHIMSESNIKLCLGHDLSQYQMDCLETTMIAFLLLTFGMRTTNKTVYSKYIYRRLPAGVEIDDRDSHPNPQQYGTNTYGLMRRALVIGTCPPQTTLTSPNYVQNIREWLGHVNNGRRVPNPLLNWDSASRDSHNIRALKDQLQSDDDYLPPFINHHPTLVSGNLREQYYNLESTQLLEADRRVQMSISVLQKDVIIMLGARPTLLFAKQQRKHFFASVHEISPEQIGLDAYEATNVITWINDHPTSLQLQDLLITLTSRWLTSESYTNEEVPRYRTVQPFKLIREYNMDRNVLSNLPTIDQDLMIKTSVTMPNLTLSDVIGDWSLRSTVKLVNQAIRKIPNFHALDETEAASKLQALARSEITKLRQGWMQKYVSAGLFVPQEMETADQQFSRFFKMINLERMLRGTHPSSLTHTCCWCGQLAARVPQSRGKVNFSTIRDGCPNGMVHSLGWEAVVGAFDDIFPSANIFLMFFEWLPTGEVMNHWQIAAAFVMFITDNRWHVQAKALYDANHYLFAKISSFQLDEDSSGPGATFIKAVTSAMKKLALLDPPCNVEVGSRQALPEEVAWSLGFRYKKSLVGIRVFLKEREDRDIALARLEDHRHMGYALKLGIVRTYRDYYVEK